MTFYFYDLETSGINARAQRIMQFAGQRTDQNFKPIGKTQNWLIKLTDEVIPDPDAIVITGITPQKTLEEGYTEAEFLELFYKEVLQPDTIIMGFNTIRFDDEFMRMTLWRNFYDPYEWQWQNGRSRWDLLDTVRMVRALRPEGITWPVDANGQPTNRLELLTKANGLDHTHAHDALSDVYATIELAALLKEKQPKMFSYLLDIRTKKQLADIIDASDPRPFVYTSGRYSSKWHKTTVVAAIASVENGVVLVYDLRQDPEDLIPLTDDELKEAAFGRSQTTEILPVKSLKINCCPAVAPLGVLDSASQERLNISTSQIKENFRKLLSNRDFINRLKLLFEQKQNERSKKYPTESDPDFQIYDGFVSDTDKTKMRAIRAAKGSQISELSLNFSDQRLEKLLPRYKARNAPHSLSALEREQWEQYRSSRIVRGVNGQLSLQQFAQRLSQLAAINVDDENAQYLLQELQLYAENIAPFVD